MSTIPTAPIKTMKLFEPAMCCATGVCGPGVDPELLRITAVVRAANQEHQRIHRFNLKDNPMNFVENAVVQQLLKEKGMAVLPLALVDDQVLSMGGYPSNQAIAQALHIDEVLLESAASARPQKPKVKLSDLKIKPFDKGGADGTR